MSRILAHLFLFCDTNKDSSRILRITRYGHGEEVSEHACNQVQFEMASYDSLNIIENQGKRVLSFMLEGCISNYEEKSVKLYHSNELYLLFEFID